MQTTRGEFYGLGPKCQNVCAGLTSVRGVESGEGDDEEGGGVFPSIHQVREGPLGVSVTPQALDEAEPGGQTLDDGAQAVRVAVAQGDGFCKRHRDSLEPLPSFPLSAFLQTGLVAVCGEAHQRSHLATVSISLAAW